MRKVTLEITEALERLLSTYTLAAIFDVSRHADAVEEIVINFPQGKLYGMRIVVRQE